MWHKKLFAPLALPIHLFAGAILCGAFLLCQPVSCQGRPISFLDALFTATSAACVTGLAVVDTGTAFTRFGQTVILALIQLGGLGKFGFHMGRCLTELGRTMFIPERFAAKNMAHQLASPWLIEYLPMNKDVAIKEIGIDDWTGKTLRQLDLTNKHKVQVIAKKLSGTARYTFIPRAGEALAAGDKLVLDRLARLRPCA